jgi:hypothetical protein
MLLPEAISCRVYLFGLNIDSVWVYGFRQTADVSVTAGGTQQTLSILTYHAAGDKTYTVDNEGTIHE